MSTWRFEYRLQVETAMGISLPPMAEHGEDPERVDPAIADQIAIMAAQASQMLLQQNQQEAKQQQAQQQMQDPVVQMQMQELQLKGQELQLKQQKQAMDAAAKADQIRIEESRIAAQKEIAAMQVAANAAAAKDKLKQAQESEGARLGVDIANTGHRWPCKTRNGRRNEISLATNPKRKMIERLTKLCP
jgi:hypothetical protein